jgi:hypothetical protein
LRTSALRAEAFGLRLAFAFFAVPARPSAWALSPLVAGRLPDLAFGFPAPSPAPVSALVAMATA